MVKSLPSAGLENVPTALSQAMCVLNAWNHLLSENRGSPLGQWKISVRNQTSCGIRTCSTDSAFIESTLLFTSSWKLWGKSPISLLPTAPNPFPSKTVLLRKPRTMDSWRDSVLVSYCCWLWSRSGALWAWVVYILTHISQVASGEHTSQRPSPSPWLSSRHTSRRGPSLIFLGKG